MAFRVKHGSIDSISKLATLTGEAIQGEKQQRLALDIAMRLNEQKRQQEMAEFEMMMQMERQKAQLQWQMQSQMMRQQHDFEMSERLRMQEIEQQYLKDQKKKSEFEAAVNAIDNSEILSDNEKEQMRTNTAMKFNVGPYAPQVPEQMDSLKQAQAESKAMRDLEDDLVYYNDMLNKFSDKKDLSYMPFKGGRGAGDMAVMRADGTWEPATEQDMTMYDFFQQKAGALMNKLRYANRMPTGAASGAAMPHPEL